MSNPCLLALDTAGDTIAAGLLTADGAFSLNEPGGALASARLLPTLMAWLQDHQVTVARLQAIGFGQGPGAFTGLRTACAVAQGLALAHNTPVLALDSLMILAEDARHQGPDAAPFEQTGWVVVDARMDEAYAAAYRWHAGRWQVVQAPALWTLPALAEAWRADTPAWAAGNGLLAFAGRLPDVTGPRPAEQHDRGAALLRLAQAAWDDGLAITPDEALPLYLRDKVAQTTAEREALKQAAR